METKTKPEAAFEVAIDNKERPVRHGANFYCLNCGSSDTSGSGAHSDCYPHGMRVGEVFGDFKCYRCGQEGPAVGVE